jgi:putative ATP-dependent endonuclease of the OLD family
MGARRVSSRRSHRWKACAPDFVGTPGVVCRTRARPIFVYKPAQVALARESSLFDLKEQRHRGTLDAGPRVRPTLRRVEPVPGAQDQARLTPYHQRPVATCVCSQARQITGGPSTDDRVGAARYSRGMIDMTIKIANYRSYGETPEGLTSIPHVTVIVGRNNAGKSALLDAVELAIDPKAQPTERGDLPPILQVSRRAGQDEVHTALNGRDQRLIKHFKGATFTWNWLLDPTFKDRRGGASFVSCHLADQQLEPEPGENGGRVLQLLAGSTLQGFMLRRIAAERDVRPEGSGGMEVAPNGGGATQLLYYFANRADITRQHLEQTFLSALNAVFEPDLKFQRVSVFDRNGNGWEIFLREEGKGDIALSKSGSGIKTVVLVLCHLILMPILDKLPLSRKIFAFEELENNLHPGVLRRLLAYIRSLAKAQNTHFLLTTHSSVVIDAFSNDSEAQIVHVTHDGEQSRVVRVGTYLSTRSALTDLGVRASDLLQANCIVWVEGPSDQIYINRWIEIVSQGRLREGLHYQCVFYGGSLLARLDAELPDERKAENSVNLLRVNGHACVVMDSDKAGESTSINATKKRVVEEVVKAGGTAWITHGRDIENYLPPRAIAQVLGLPTEPPTVGPYERFEDYLERLLPGAGTNFSRHKATFAAQVAPLLNPSSLEMLDLKKQAEALAAKIRAWNRA